MVFLGWVIRGKNSERFICSGKLIQAICFTINIAFVAFAIVVVVVLKLLLLFRQYLA
jgi:hypothetical protein